VDVCSEMHGPDMKAVPPTNAEWRVRLAPLRTWAALSLVGLVISLVRSVLYGAPFVPVGVGLTPLVVLTTLGALYAAVVFSWLALRRIWVR